MGNLLQAELYKITHTKVMAICLFFTAGIEFLNSFLHGGNQIDTMTLLVEIIGLIICALFSGLFIGTDFSGRTIIHTVTSGKSRSCVWISKYLSFFMACIVLLSVNALAANAGFLLFHRAGLVFPLTGMTAVVLYTFAGIVYDLCLASLFFMITMQIKESGISIAVSTLFVAVMISNSELLWVDRMFPLLNAQTVMNGIPFRHFLALLPVPVIVLCAGLQFFKRRDL